MDRKTIRTLSCVLAVLSLAVAAAPVYGQGCPAINAIGNFKPSNDGLQASFTVSTVTNPNDTATYTFTSNDESPVDGVPGLIEYCVYPGSPPLMPDSTAASAAGDDGSAWTSSIKSAQKFFSFGRADGNPSNIGLNGTTSTMGTATWANGVPDTQTIVLHINDADECDALYGGNPGTCFVLPGSAPESKPPTVLKDATPSFDRTFKWSISKSVDKTSVKQIGGTATFNYTVTVTHDGGTDSNWQVNGKIVVTNPNVFDIDHADVTDAVNDGGTCSVTGGADVTLPSGMTTFNYSCTYASAPNPAAGTNTATVKWPDQGTLEAGTATYDATFDFGATSPNSIDECVSVSDSVQGLLGTVCVGDANPTTFSYSRTVPVPAFDCVSYDNTATFTTKDTGSTGSAGQTVTVCGPAKTGALTMGFWQNNNGQGIIKGGAATAGVCNSGTWLRQYAPFQDLSATATCAQVATYVYNVIKAANASGAAMNAMLKAQMLATALDVYFSDPALGGNKINAPSPVGGRSIDLTLINKPIGGATFENTSGAFGGATCKTVLDLLSYAASQSNSGGTVWYGQVKATQELAKDTFDAINNQKAFGC